MSAELSAKYTPSEIEDKWYSHWLKKNYFHSEPDDREAFSIVIPPPNVTGILHMGHLLNNTIQDTLIRKARMEGKNACWVAGTDHASIATEAKVVKWLREEKKLRKADLTRDEFLEYAWQWKEKYGGIILNQLQKLGASCDWERTAFTMDDIRSEGVLRVFVDLYKKGKLYRDYRMVNWDCEAKTVLSNEEVIHGEENAQLYHVRYKVEGTDNEYVTIATQRPETIMGDTAVAVNPNDERYKHLKGKNVIVPIVNRSVPLIFDDYVDKEFGTGALKVTPAHDTNDYELGKKHNLELIDTLNDDGTMSQHAAQFVGLDRFEARKRMKKTLEELDVLVKIEDYRTNIGRSERTNSVVEPRMSLQWYVDMKSIADPALESVMNDTIEFFPKSFKNTYRHWLENIRDWCISRQLWWGHRIPAWYYDGQTYVALTAEEALLEAQNATKNPNLTISDLRQDEDVLDTWFSSWLWPITVFDGFNPDSKDFPYYYPTNVLVTGWDIIFLWVARMAMAGYEWKQEKPFHAVYFTGMVRDKQRRKMSKSLGNSPDALELLATFGADGVRFGLLYSSPAGGDLLFDEKLCEQGRNFCNKLWNAMRLVKGWQIDGDIDMPRTSKLAGDWFYAKMETVLVDIEKNFQQFRLSEALMSLYNFIWDDFCSWYLEMIKPAYGEPIDARTFAQTIDIYERLMQILHPFMPFVTEEIWHQLRERKAGEDCTISQLAGLPTTYPIVGQKVETVKDLISKIRDTRNAKGVKQKEELEIFIQQSDSARQLFDLQGLQSLVAKMANLSALTFVEKEPENAVSFIAGTDKYYMVLNQTIDVAAEREKLTKELDYAQKFVLSVENKLKNEKFVANAKPEVIASERKKLADGEERVRILEESLTKLG